MIGSTQKPVHSGFGARSTAVEVLVDIKLSGKTAIVTGGYSGLGLETTRALAAVGAEVIVAARRPEIAAAVMADLDGVEVRALDLADLPGVAAFAECMLNDYPAIDILINSAGIMACPETRVGPGWEAQLATNHLGHFALVQHLWPGLSGGHGSRVISVSSGAHGITGIRWNDIHFTAGYDRWQAYGQSKTANALFAVHLDALGRDTGVRAFSLHPGSILTPLQRHLSREEMVVAGWIDETGALKDESFKTPQQGAATQVWAATSPQLDGMGGVYCKDCDIAPVVGGTIKDGVLAHAVDQDEAARLWAVSTELTGLDRIPA
jgi:NAD(P)-dependent dehydrogenase (short-subunit alcohol dehydrogenase family)